MKGNNVLRIESGGILYTFRGRDLVEYLAN